MRFRDLPAVYARFGARIAGSVAHRVEDVLPGPLGAIARTSSRVASHLMPGPIREGWQDGHREEDAKPPVLLVPGFLGPALLLVPLAVFLRAHGREAEILHTFPALGGVEASAKRVAKAVKHLRERTGATRVDLVAHSMGGLACRHYMDHLMETPEVRRFISIATPHLGTRWAHLPFTRSARDMKPGSEFLAAMGDRSPAPGVRCYTIRAGWDQIVWPREHGRWEKHAKDHELSWAEHWAVQLDPRTLALVQTLLDEPDETLDEEIPVEAASV